jgi:hypothetical protein
LGQLPRIAAPDLNDKAALVGGLVVQFRPNRLACAASRCFRRLRIFLERLDILSSPLAAYPPLWLRLQSNSQIVTASASWRAQPAPAGYFDGKYEKLAGSLGSEEDAKIVAKALSDRDMARYVSECADQTRFESRSFKEIAEQHGITWFDE